MNSYELYRRCGKCHCGVGSRKGVGAVVSASKLSMLLTFIRHDSSRLFSAKY